MKFTEIDRKLSIYTCIALLILLIVPAIVFLGIYFNKNKTEYISYNENGKIKYEVALKENDFFDNKYLEENSQYIAALVDHINADFKYNAKLPEDYNYDMKYKVMSNISVFDKETNRPLYESNDSIIDELEVKSGSSLMIDENVKIDYKKYNDLINEFVKVYNLKNVTSKLSVNLFVEIIEQDLKIKTYDTPVLTMDIPLTTNTIAIDVTDKIQTEKENSIVLPNNNKDTVLWRNLAIIIFAIDACLWICFIIYVLATATDEDKYKANLRKILNSYGSYISKIEDEFNMDGYQILKVSNFIDLLEIRDTIHVPIIMIENKEQMVTCFAIPSNEILYFYSLSIGQYALPEGEKTNV